VAARRRACLSGSKTTRRQRVAGQSFSRPRARALKSRPGPSGGSTSSDGSSASAVKGLVTRRGALPATVPLLPNQPAGSSARHRHRRGGGRDVGGSAGWRAAAVGVTRHERTEQAHEVSRAAPATESAGGTGSLINGRRGGLCATADAPEHDEYATRAPQSIFGLLWPICSACSQLRPSWLSQNVTRDSLRS